jgi:hypothetical protein
VNADESRLPDKFALVALVAVSAAFAMSLAAAESARAAAGTFPI